jgi:hypothetical protein
MNLVRTLTWALMIGAGALAGPNLPAQGLASLREFLAMVRRQLCFGREPSGH